MVKPFDEKELRAAIEIALYKHKEEKQVKERLLHELQSTTQKISGLAREMAEQSSPGSLSPLAPSVLESPAPVEQEKPEKTYTIKEAAKYLGISDRTIQRMIKEGIFPEPSVTIDLGGNRKLRRWKQADLEVCRPHLRQRGRPRNS